mmetsp:Transcript_11021/g.25204  ORF Transcript_11021/g.25204 Transcript_11021/m.25204 type:complete len:114 (-) Transcript_11021:652-993(-)
MLRASALMLVRMCNGKAFRRMRMATAAEQQNTRLREPQSFCESLVCIMASHWAPTCLIRNSTLEMSVVARGVQPNVCMVTQDMQRFNLEAPTSDGAKSFIQAVFPSINLQTKI